METFIFKGIFIGKDNSEYFNKWETYQFKQIDNKYFETIDKDGDKTYFGKNFILMNFKTLDNYHISKILK